MADEYVYEDSMQKGQNEERFKRFSKRFTREYTDVNNGSYSGSQIQFNLPSISTEEGFLSLKECSITFPYVINIASSGALAAYKDRQASLKAGVQTLVSGVSVKIDNQTVKNVDCATENIPLTYQILSSSSPSDEANLFDSLIFSPDNADGLAYQVGAGETNGVLIDALPVVGSTLESFEHNTGLVRRMQKTCFNPAAPQSAKFTDIAKTVARRKSHVVDGGTQQTTYHLMITIPLRFLSMDLFSQFGLQRGLFMQINVNIHSGSSSFVLTHATQAISAHVPVTRFGVQPVMLALPDQSWESTVDTTITVSSGIVSAGGVQNDFGMSAATFNAVFYRLRAEDEAEYLSAVPQQLIRYTQMYNHEQNAVPAGAAFSAKVSNSSSKMRYLLIHPSLSAVANGSANASDTTGGTCSTPNSLFSSSPVTTMRHSSVINLQILVGGQPVYETPKTYGYDMFQQEIRPHSSLNAGLELGLSSGLISERMWESGYGYIVIDLSRTETDAADMVSKPLEVRGTNNTLCSVDYSFYLMTEAEFTINTSTGKITM